MCVCVRDEHCQRTTLGVISLLSFMGPEDRTQVIRLGGKGTVNPLSRLAGLDVPF